MRILRTVVVVLLVLRLGGEAYKYKGENRRTRPCNHNEAVVVQAAVKQLGACSDIDADEVRSALITQAATHAAVLGSVDVDGLSACLVEQQEQGDRGAGALGADCQRYLDKLDDKAEADDGSIGWKIASKLKQDPETYCGCIALINADVGPECTGLGVVRGDLEMGPSA